MNWFKIAKYICRGIDGINRNFFWEDNYGNNGNQYWLQNIASDNISSPKCNGGLGIWKYEDTNVLFNKGWKILSQPGSICVKLVKAIYLKNNSSNLLTINEASSAFNSLKSILNQRYLLKKCLFWIFDSENCIKFCHDIWMDDSPLNNRIRSNEEEFINHQARVNDFIDNTKKWQLKSEEYTTRWYYWSNKSYSHSD